MYKHKKSTLSVSFEWNVVRENVYWIEHRAEIEEWDWLRGEPELGQVTSRREWEIYKRASGYQPKDPPANAHYPRLVRALRKRKSLPWATNIGPAREVLDEVLELYEHLMKTNYANSKSSFRKRVLMFANSYTPFATRHYNTVLTEGTDPTGSSRMKNLPLQWGLSLDCWALKTAQVCGAVMLDARMRNALEAGGSLQEIFDWAREFSRGDHAVARWPRALLGVSTLYSQNYDPEDVQKARVRLAQIILDWALGGGYINNQPPKFTLEPTLGLHVGVCDWAMFELYRRISGGSGGRICKECGGPFVPMKRSDAQTCGGACRQRALEARRKAAAQSSSIPKSM